LRKVLGSWRWQLRCVQLPRPEAEGGFVSNDQIAGAIFFVVVVGVIVARWLIPMRRD
jgi:hypothetical protein